MLFNMEFYEEASMQDGSHSFFVVTFAVIIILNLFSIFYYIFNLFVAIRVQHYKTNLHKIHQAIYATCPISSVFLIVENSLNIFGSHREWNPSEQKVMMFLEYVRTAMMSPPLFSLIGIMLERIFATIYVRDYEQRPRSFVGYGIIALLAALSVVTAFVFHATNHIVIFVGCHFFLNILSFIISLFNYRLNRRYYHNNRVVKHEYSLGERFQIAENLRMFQFFSSYLFVLGFFTICCTGIALFANYDTSPSHRNILSVLFDLSFTLLCIFAPYLVIKMSEAWQNELDLIYVKVGLRRVTKVRNVDDRTKRLKNTFGEVMEFETSKHSDLYFDQLKRSWNRHEFSTAKAGK